MANVALRDCSLDAFLYSEVGTEASGSSLTILSLLARLGKDPWDEAAAWSRKPRDAATRLLADSIARMPPSQQAFDDARVTAARLTNLLPNHDAPRGATTLSPALTAIPWATLLVFFCVVLFLAFNLWTVLAAKPEAAPTPAIHEVAAPLK